MDIPKNAGNGIISFTRTSKLTTTSVSLMFATKEKVAFLTKVKSVIYKYS